MESNKTEVLCFGKHWDKYCILSNCEEYEARFHFQSGQQSKQDEIDELKKNFNNALKTIDIQQQFLDDTDGTIKIITSQVDELQNRIDELKMANHNLSVMTAEAESYSDYWKYELDKLQKRVNELELINFDSELHFDAAKEHIDSLQKQLDEIKELNNERK